MAESKTIAISTGGKERIETISKLYQEAFKDDPVITYMLLKFSDQARREYLFAYFKKLLTAAGMNDGIFEEAKDFSAATCILPPGKKVDNPLTLVPAGLAGLLVQVGLRSCYRMLFEFGSKTDAAKKRGLQGHKRYWYLFFIAALPSCQGQGLGTAMVKQLQARAAKHDLPCWLEATTENSMKMYLKCGFEIVEVITLGKGHADASGKQKPNGEGVRIWAMVWWPPTMQENVENRASGHNNTKAM